MTIAQIKAVAAKAVADAMMNFTGTASAPPVPKPAAKGKRTLSPEQKAKMAAGRAAAKAARAGTTPTVPKPAATRKAAAKPAAESGVVVTFGAIETLDYEREDGTPGIVIRPKGRKRGIGLAKGDWDLFVAMANTFREGKTMGPLAERVKARIGG